jgi:hydroxymethylbilane synthase
MQPVIRLGTRGSALARWQTEHICTLLCELWPDLKCEIVVVSTQGDQVLDTPLPLIGGKGVFTTELEAALRAAQIDLAVHSLKDLPTDDSPGLTIGAIPRRADPRDVLVSRQGYTLKSLPLDAAVGTSSTRRAAQLHFRHPKLRLLDIRGNVDTRVRKALVSEGPYDAIVLARAGLERLGLTNVITQVLSFEQMLPAPGQGALAVQCRDDKSMLDLLAPLNHQPSRLAVEAERSFLAALGGGCAVPIAAYAEFTEPGLLSLRGRVCAQDGSTQIEGSGACSDTGEIDVETARQLGIDVAHKALEQGAAALLSKV